LCTSASFLCAAGVSSTGIILICFALFGKTKSTSSSADPRLARQPEGVDSVRGKKLDTSSSFSLYTLSYLPVQSVISKVRLYTVTSCCGSMETRYMDHALTSRELEEMRKSHRLPGKEFVVMR